MAALQTLPNSALLITRDPRHPQIDTTMGSFTVELYYKHAPRTVENFTKLADKGYYDGTIFHRIIRDFSESLLPLILLETA